MTFTFWEAILIGLAPAVTTGLVAWGAIRSDLKTLRRDVDALQSEVFGPPGRRGLRDKVMLLVEKHGG